MQTVTIDIHKYEWLSEALMRHGYGGVIPSNIILDKTVTGLGATHCELYAHRNSIIIEPNVPVILCKLDNEDLKLEGVYEKVTPMPLSKYLTSQDITYKKILTTPESFYKITREALKTGIDIFSEDWFCLYDECEKIVQDHDYRPSISLPMQDFFSFKRKAMVSATPLEPSHPMFETQNFKRLKILPSYNYRKDLILIVTNSFKRTLTERIAELAQSECICIFMNKTDSIEAIIEELGMNDYKIFCSEKSVKKLNGRGISNAFSQIDYPLARYNFFTCRFYSGLDITIFPILPDIIMLTDLRTATYTMIDPLTEAIQIQGRFRKGDVEGITYKSLTHISTVNPNMKFFSRGELNRMVERYADTYTHLMEEHNTEKDSARKTAINTDMKNLKYRDLLNDNGTLNYFALDNLYNEERVKSYYMSPESLLNAYESSNYFNVLFIPHIYTVGEDDIFRINQSKLAIERRKLITEALERIETDFKNGRIDEASKRIYLEPLSMIDEGVFVIQSYKKIGADGLKKCGYKKSLIEEAIKGYDKEEAEKLRFSPQVIDEIQAEYEIGVYLSKKVIQERLKQIYAKYGIKYKVTQTTITDYYSKYKESNSKKDPSYKLLQFRF
ncbi:MAG: hypothetical protein J1F67_00015 [Muribaculaceae bacterium]|nr:hypothetical protein [Muribaculaceae bacterium]